MYFVTNQDSYFISVLFELVSKLDARHKGSHDNRAVNDFFIREKLSDVLFTTSLPNRSGQLIDKILTRSTDKNLHILAKILQGREYNLRDEHRLSSSHNSRDNVPLSTFQALDYNRQCSTLPFSRWKRRAFPIVIIHLNSPLRMNLALPIRIILRDASF